MSRQEAGVAMELYRAGERPVPFWALETNREAQRSGEPLVSNSIKVVIHRVRRKLGGKDMIDHVWGTGYVMTPAGRAKIDAVLRV
jgi:DNA-binding response OmpR family regulator